MFTAEQIQTAHSKVKSGADFPSYIQEIKSLGVTHYETYVTDGHVHYHGANHYSVTTPPKYGPLPIAHATNVGIFKAELLAHQQGKTDYHTFINACAQYGVARWAVSIVNMTCTYYGYAGDELLIEKVPSIESSN